MQQIEPELFLSHLYAKGIIDDFKKYIDSGKKKDYLLKNNNLTKSLCAMDISGKNYVPENNTNIRELTIKLRSVATNGNDVSAFDYSPIIKNSNKGISMNSDAVRAIYELTIALKIVKAKISF